LFSIRNFAYLCLHSQELIAERTAFKDAMQQTMAEASPMASAAKATPVKRSVFGSSKKGKG